MRRFSIAAAFVTLAIFLSAGVIYAQTPAPSTSPSSPPSPGSTTTTPAPTPRVEKMEKVEPGLVEGTVKKVDPAENKIRVGSGLFGLFGRTVDVTSNTTIMVEGRKASLADVTEGSRAKVAYETRDGRTIATNIEVMQAERAR